VFQEAKRVRVISYQPPPPPAPPLKCHVLFEWPLSQPRVNKSEAVEDALCFLRQNKKKRDLVIYYLDLSLLFLSRLISLFFASKSFFLVKSLGRKFHFEIYQNFNFLSTKGRKRLTFPNLF